MIPELQANGELPPGEHLTTIEEIEMRFGSQNAKRRVLMTGLRRAVSEFQAAGVRVVWVDGSFVTNKLLPNDIDGVWRYERQVVDRSKISPVFFGKTRSDRQMMKLEYGLDFYLDGIEAGSKLPFPKFFQINRDGKPKGILKLCFGEHDDNE